MTPQKSESNFFAKIRENWQIFFFLIGLLVGGVEMRMQVHYLEKRFERKEAEDSRKMTFEFKRLSDQIEKMNEKLSTVAEDVARINGRLGAKE